MVTTLHPPCYTSLHVVSSLLVAPSLPLLQSPHHRNHGNSGLDPDNCDTPLLHDVPSPPPPRTSTDDNWGWGDDDPWGDNNKTKTDDSTTKKADDDGWGSWGNDEQGDLLLDFEDNP